MTNADRDSVDGPSGDTVEVSVALHDQQPVIANLFELYAYDLSQTFDLHVGSDGRYGYQSLPLYWEQASRFPFVIKVDGYLAGFALVSRGSLISGHPDVWDMTEFFVLRRYRRTGVGAKVAHDIWRRHAGCWEVRVLETNIPAQMFWHAAIRRFTGVATQPIRVEQGGKLRLCYTFDCMSSAPNKPIWTPPASRE